MSSAYTPAKEAWIRLIRFTLLFLFLYIINHGIQVLVKRSGNVPYLFDDMFILPILLALLLEKQLDIAPFSKFGLNFRSRWWLNLLKGFAGGAVLTVALFGLAHLLNLGELSWSIERISLLWVESFWYMAEILIFGSLIIFSRELMFRGFYFPVISTWTGPLVAILVSSALFALFQNISFHVNYANVRAINFQLWLYYFDFDPQLLAYYFVLGILLGMMAFKTGSIWMSVGFYFSFYLNHMFVKALGFDFGGFLSTKTVAISYGYNTTALFIFCYAVIALVWLVRTPWRSLKRKTS